MMKGNTMSNWTKNSVFYHIYPLGMCGAPQHNDETEPQHRIRKLLKWVNHLKAMNIGAVYFGPVFDSSNHGYDTRDFNRIDMRLGDDADFCELSDALHKAGIRIVVDGVFNHVGREFWAFRDVQQHGAESPYCGWFANLNFGGQSPMGDPFWYEGWEGHYELVKLNLRNPEVVEHILSAVGKWIDEYDIDGLRLDVAYCLDFDFLRTLSAYTRSKKPDFWLMGEVIHGDYSRFINPELLDSTTNYECYKGLYSSHNDKNYFEIAHSIARQFGNGGNGGIYNGIVTYNFVDNHDVTRIHSILRDKSHMENVYTLLFTMPGVPSIYYGSEFAIDGEKQNGSDAQLRPALDIEDFDCNTPLVRHISALAKMKRTLEPLADGVYEQIILKNKELAFRRICGHGEVFVTLNIDDCAVTHSLPCTDVLYDFESGEQFAPENGYVSVMTESCKSRVLGSEKMMEAYTNGLCSD